MNERKSFTTIFAPMSLSMRNLNDPESAASLSAVGQIRDKDSVIHLIMALDHIPLQYVYHPNLRSQMEKYGGPSAYWRDYFQLLDDAWGGNFIYCQEHEKFVREAFEKKDPPTIHEVFACGWDVFRRTDPKVPGFNETHAAIILASISRYFGRNPFSYIKRVVEEPTENSGGTLKRDPENPAESAYPLQKMHLRDLQKDVPLNSDSLSGSYGKFSLRDLGNENRERQRAIRIQDCFMRINVHAYFEAQYRFFMDRYRMTRKKKWRKCAQKSLITAFSLEEEEEDLMKGTERMHGSSLNRLTVGDLLNYATAVMIEYQDNQEDIPFAFQIVRALLVRPVLAVSGSMESLEWKGDTDDQKI